MDPKLHILAHITQLSLLDVALGKYQLTVAQQCMYDRALFELANHRPLSKIINQSSFYGRDFYVNEHVLDPRPESEMFIEIAKSLPETIATVLDLGSGSGCLGITLSLELQASCLYADICPQALSVTKDNTYRHNCNRARFVQSNWFSNIETQLFDLIVCNPPYVQHTVGYDMRVHDPYVIEHAPELEYDPPLALYAHGPEHYVSVIRGLQHYAGKYTIFEVPTEYVASLYPLIPDCFAIRIHPCWVDNIVFIVLHRKYV